MPGASTTKRAPGSRSRIDPRLGHQPILTRGQTPPTKPLELASFELRTIGARLSLNSFSGGHTAHTVIDVRWLARFERAGLVCLAAAAAIGAVGLVGWVVGIPLLTSGPAIGEIRPTQPWAFVLMIAAAVGIRSGLFKSPARRTGRLLLFTMFVFSVAFVFARSLPEPEAIPSWVRLVPEGGSLSGLLATNQAFILGSVAIGALLVTSSRLAIRLPGQFLAAVAAVLAAFVLTAFTYGDRDLSRFPFGSGEMGLPGAAGSLLLSAAVLLARPQDPLLRPLVSANLGGELLRWLVPIALLLPAALVGTVRVQARFGTPGILAAVTVTFTVLLMTGLLYASRRVDMYASRGRRAEEEASRATDALEQVAPVMSDLVDILHSVSMDRAGKVHISTRHLPAKGLLAGDSLAVFPIEEQVIGIVMVDAAGHGARPALHSLRIRDCLSQALREGATPAAAITGVTWLFESVDTTATAAVALVNGQSGDVTYSLAGHPPPFVDRGGSFGQEPSGGSLLHAQADVGWVDRTVVLSPGDHFLLFTDGVADVFDEGNGDDFDALAAFLHHIGPRSPDEIADACVDFANQRQRTDDAAVIVLTLAR